MVEAAEHSADRALPRKAIGHHRRAERREFVGVAADEDDGLGSDGAQRVDHPVAHGSTVDVDQGLGPPHPPAAATCQHGAGNPHVAGMPDGSSWSRNCSQRSASSVSPISAAIWPRPRSDRRNP